MTRLQRFFTFMAGPEAREAALVSANKELAAALGRTVLAQSFAEATNGMLNTRLEQLSKEVAEMRAENSVLRQSLGAGGMYVGTA